MNSRYECCGQGMIALSSTGLCQRVLDDGCSRRSVGTHHFQVSCGEIGTRIVYCNPLCYGEHRSRAGGELSYECRLNAGAIRYITTHILLSCGSRTRWMNLAHTERD
jgi:hypothetical protein